MKTIRERLNIHRAVDSGLTLIEVMVAMFIFSLVSIGLIFTMISVMGVTRDSRVRQVAANLAAQEIDLARDVENVADDLGGATRHEELNGDSFTIERASTWATQDGSAAAGCGTTTGTLMYKHIRVEVTWGGMRGDTGVVSETLVNPNERVTHPDFGTLMVTVQNAVPKGFSGVTVSARPAGSPGAAVVASGVTDSNGCAYLLQVPPGIYDLTIAGSHGEQFISAGGGIPSETQSALAGEASAVLFDVRILGTLDVRYVHRDGASSTSISTGRLPTNMATSVINTGSSYLSKRSDNTTFPKIGVVLDESTTLIAGDVFGCLATDPQEWPDTATKEAGEREPSVVVEDSSPVTVEVPMRLVTVKNSSWSRRFVTAVSYDTEPGCSTTQTYRFSADSSTHDIALPYGNWVLYRGNSSGSLSTMLNSSSIELSGDDSLSVISGRQVVTLDPRVDQ